MIKEKIKKGEPIFGFLSMWACPGIIEAVGSGFDFCWIDAQHGQWQYRDIINAVRACELVRIASLVRVPDHAPGWIGRILDLDATGIIAPLVDSVEQARMIVKAAHSPPLGNRSFGGRRVIDRNGRGYARDSEKTPLVIVQIESPEAVENSEAIAAVNGIDVLFFGPDDMKARLGIEMDTPLHSPPIAPLFAKVAAACEAKSKSLMVIAPTVESLKFALETGANIIAVGADSGFMKSSSAAALKMIERVR